MFNLKNLMVVLFSSSVLLSGCSSIAEKEGEGDVPKVSKDDPNYEIYAPDEYYVPKLKDKEGGDVDKEVFDQNVEFLDEAKSSSDSYTASKDENKMVFFEYDSFALDSSYNDKLNSMVERLKAHPEYKVIVEGHADERGTSSYNMYLGSKRAGVVKDYLVSKGVSNEIKIISYGETSPLNDIKDYDKNRRAVVEFLK